MGNVSCSTMLLLFSEAEVKSSCYRVNMLGSLTSNRLNTL